MGLVVKVTYEAEECSRFAAVMELEKGAVARSTGMHHWRGGPFPASVVLRVQMRGLDGQ